MSRDGDQPWAEELRAFYEAHLGDDGARAAKIAQIPAILASYEGDEIELLAQLHAKYDVPIPRDRWWAAGALACFLFRNLPRPRKSVQNT